MLFRLVLRELPECRHIIIIIIIKQSFLLKLRFIRLNGLVVTTGCSEFCTTTLCLRTNSDWKKPLVATRYFSIVALVRTQPKSPVGLEIGPSREFGCTLVEGATFLGVRKAYLGIQRSAKVVLIKKLFVIQKTFFGIQKTFFGIQKTFSGYKKLLLSKIQKHHENYNKTKILKKNVVFLKTNKKR